MFPAACGVNNKMISAFIHLIISVCLFVGRDETPHTRENEGNGRLDVPEGAPRYRKVQSCIGEGPNKPGKI